VYLITQIILSPLKNAIHLNNYTLVVIGGGAAGLFCAVNAARMNPSLKVIIVEKTSKLLSKVKVSGGGRCNVTHACFEIPELIKCYPREKIYSHRYTAIRFIKPTSYNSYRQIHLFLM